MNAPNLHVETSAAMMLAEAMREHGFDEESVQLSISSETSFPEAVSAALQRLAELAEHEEAAKRLATTYRDRATALDFRQERLREALVEALERSGAPLPMRLAEATITVSRPAPSARVTDELALPAEYVLTKVVTRPDMKAITAALRAGTAVAGASLGNSRPSLVVRRA